jgi:hypothetical protein
MEETTARREGIIRYAFRVTGFMLRSTIEGTIDFISDHLRQLTREPALFLGAALLLVGLLSFESGKYCDGNTAQYLSCTRPAVYYYFDALDVTSAVLGAFFMLAWMVKRRA